MRGRSRFGARRWGAAGGVAVLALASLGFMSRGEGYEASRVELSGGGAWLASVSQRLVTLIDGASEQVVGSIEAPGAKAGDALSVVQSGASAYVVNGSQGTVSRVDGGTYKPSDPVLFGAAGGDALGVFAGRQALYVVDGQRRTASVTDPVSLRVRDKLSLAAQPGPEQAVVDDSGRLWVIDRGRGGLTWFDDGKRVRPEVGDAASRLVLVQGRPVLVDTARSRVGALSPSGGVEAWSCLEVRAGDQAQVLGSQSSARVYAAVSATGTLVASTVGRDDCEVSVNVGAPRDDFGPLVEVGTFVFVPNRTSGETIVVDTSTGQVAAKLAVVKKGARLELLAKDGFVFYNDLDGDQAGVIRFDGGVWRKGRSLKKYDVSDKGKGILTPVKDEPPSNEPPTEDPEGNGGKDPVQPTPQDPVGPQPPAPPPQTPPTPPPSAAVSLTVQVSGPGAVFAEDPAPDGRPAGTECGGGSTCVWRYPAGTRVVLRVPETVGDATLDGLTGCHAQSAGGGNRRCELTLSAPATVTATFRSAAPPVQVNLTVNVGGNGSVTGNGIDCPPTCSATYDSGQRVTLTARPATGMSFVGWGGACGGSRTTCTVAMNGAATVSATFRDRPVLTVQAPSNGSVTGSGINCPPDCTATYDLRQDVTLTARPDPSYALSRWGGACGGSRTTCRVSMDGDRTVSASFVPRPRLAVEVGQGGSVRGPGINCPEGAVCEAMYDPGERITLRAEPDSGLIFIGWDGACSGQQLSCTLTMNGDKGVSASFGFSDPCPPVCRVGQAVTPAGVRVARPAAGNALPPATRPVRRRRRHGSSS